MRAVVLGGGTGGTLTANLLARKIKDVTLVSSNDIHVFQPANLDIAFKGAKPEKFVRRQSSLLSRHVRFIPDPAAKIKLEDRLLVTESGREIGYDYLVIATGSYTAPHQVEGLAQYSHNFHSGQEDSARIWEELKRFSGGKIVLLIAGVPHKCPPSPVEAMFLMDDFFRKRGLREKVELTLLTPYPRAYPAASIAEIVEPLFQERGINFLPFFNVDHVEKGVVYSMEGEKVEYDLLISIPPHTGSDVVKRSGIGDEEGWVPADKHTMRVKDYDDVNAIGDCTNIPISKSGVVAHIQAGVVAENIISDVEGGGGVARFSGRINCPLEVGGGRAIFVSGTYSRPPEKARPSRLRYLMKKGFSYMYWSMLSGRWEPFFNLYFRDSRLDGAGR
ncbi:Sulfide-quinone reductase [archaeon HR01]|nr:Sulfide-quinone reductase [archaeon HR01]